MKKRAVILSSQEGDWEGLFVDGKCIDQGHHLGGGNESKSKLFMVEQAEKYNFKLNDIAYSDVTNEDEEMLQSGGWFPETLSELSGVYDIVNPIDDNDE